MFSRMVYTPIHVLLLTCHPCLPCDWTRPLPPSIWNARNSCPLMLTLHITTILHLHESKPIKSIRCDCKHDLCCATLRPPLHVSGRSFWPLQGTWNIFVNLWILPEIGHMAPWGGQRGMSLNELLILPLPILADLHFKPSRLLKTESGKFRSRI